jgi:hypothetical protein
MKKRLLLILLLLIAFCAGAASAPKVTIDCGSLTGSGVILFETNEAKYYVRVQCGQSV